MGRGALKFMLVGLPKSGSKSIHKALKSAQIRSVHSNGMSEPVWRNWKRKRDLMAGFEHIEAICELVWFGSLKPVDITLQFERRFLLDLREQYEVGFLLNTREPASLLSSITRWRPTTRSDWIQSHLPFLPAGVGARDQDFIDGIKRHYDMIRETFSDDPLFRECDITDPAMPDVLAEMVGSAPRWWGKANVNHRNPA